MSEILIIGAGGFLGTSLARHLLNLGHTVHRLQRTPASSAGPRDILHIGSQQDVAVIAPLLSRCKTVFHLASSTTPGGSATRPSLESSLNLHPTLQFIETLQRFPDVHLIYISSGGTLYGNPATSIVDEDAPLSPLSYHGAGKLATETFLKALQHHTGQDVTILRPSNLYGPGQSLRDGFGLIRTMLEHARNGSTMPVWGDGEAIRDFLYIDDMVSACSHVMQQPPNGFSIFNVGAGEGYSINHIRLLVETVLGTPLVISYQAARQGDVRHIVLDHSKIHMALGWSASIRIDEGIRRTAQWVNSDSK